MSPWKVILATMVIFCCGVITGGLLMKSALPTAAAIEQPAHVANSTNQPPPLSQFQQPAFLRRIQKVLDLTPAQRDQIEQIMKASQERTRPIWIQVAPQLRSEMKRVKGEIRDVLKPEQQVKFDDLLRSRPRKGDGSNRPMRPPPAMQAQTNSL